MGLTMADLTLTVTENGSRVVAVSRSGELSRTHALSAPAPPLPAPGVPPGPLDADELREFVCRVMASAEESGAGWRAGIDSLRPVSNALWQRVPLDQQRRVLERDLRAWEVRRHRLAPVTSESLVGLAEHGVLRMHRGTVAAAEATPEGFEVMIDDGAPEDRMAFDAGVGRVFSYYDGFLFEVISPTVGLDSPVAAGGRYDSLLGRLSGVAASAVGCMVRPARAWVGGPL